MSLRLTGDQAEILAEASYFDDIEVVQLPSVNSVMVYRVGDDTLMLIDTDGEVFIVEKERSLV